MDIINKDFFVLDMDGTIYLDSTLFEGTHDFLEALKASGKKYMFFTNNSSKSIDDYVEKLNSLGIKAGKENIYSSGDVAINYLKKNHPGKKVYLIGTGKLRKGFEKEGIILTDTDPDVVVLGFDTELTYEKIYKGCTFIRQGAHFIATHPDSNCPVEKGLMPDCGSMIKMFTESTGVTPIVMGKPNRFTIEAIEEKVNITKDRMVFIGDRLETDIAIGFNNDVMSVLVLTGATKKEDLINSSIKPNIVAESIKDLISYIVT